MKNMIKSERAWFLGIVVFGLIARLYVFFLHQIIDYDGVYYSMLGVNLISGAGYTEPEGIYQWYYPPLYPLNIGLLWLMLNDIELSSKLVSLLYSILIIPLVYIIAKRLYGTRTAVLAGMFISIHPSFIMFATTDTAESQFSFLLLLIVLIAICAVKLPRLLSFVFLGGLCGLLFLSKPAGVQYLVFLAGTLIIIGISKKWNTTMLVFRVSALVVAFLVLSFPYLKSLKDHYGYWTLSELSTMNLARSLFLFSGENQQKVYQLTDDGKTLKYFTSSDRPAKHLELTRLFKEDPSSFTARYFHNLKQGIFLLFTNIRMIAIPLIVFMFIHFLCAQWEHERITNELILACILFPLAVAPLISTHSPRWVLPMIPIILIWGANGLSELQYKLAERPGGSFRLLKKYFTVFVVMFWMFSSTLPFLSNVRYYSAAYPYEHKELGIWMKDNLILDPMTTVMSASPHVAFYAKTKNKIMPWSEFPEMVRYAGSHGVDFIVIDETFIPEKRPLLNFLLQEGKTYPGIELTHKVCGKNGKKILLYKVLNEDV